MKTGLLLDEVYLTSINSRSHPENPERLKAIIDKLGNNDIRNRLLSIDLIYTETEILKAIDAVHSENHIKAIQSANKIYQAATNAVAGVITAIDYVMKGKCENAFCAVRPPGHHAHNNGLHYEGRNQGQGFCYFNNIAAGAKYLQSQYSCRNILIIDWDFHHGNGTEWSFYSDPHVFFFSTHALHTYPGTGFASGRGEGKGLGYNLNIPLPDFADDKCMFSAWENDFLPGLSDLGFRPDFILISAGFDSREQDYLGNFLLTDYCFARLTQIVKKMAAEYCQNRIVSVLEGGYNPAGLASAVYAHLNALSE